MASSTKTLQLSEREGLKIHSVDAHEIMYHVMILLLVFNHTRTVALVKEYRHRDNKLQVKITTLPSRRLACLLFRLTLVKPKQPPRPPRLSPA